MVRRLWWGARTDNRHYLALKDNGSLCTPKNTGGVGFRKFKNINLALLAKLGWKLAKGEVSLRTPILRAKYLNNKTFFV